MASANRVIAMGNCGRDVELRYMPDGKAVAHVSIAATERWKDKDSGKQVEHTEWIRLSFFGRLAEIAGEYLKKGSPVYVEGKLRTREWTDKAGEKRYTTEVAVENMQLLGSRGHDSQRESDAPKQSQQPQKKPAGSIADMDDDIPF